MHKKFSFEVPLFKMRLLSLGSIICILLSCSNPEHADSKNVTNWQIIEGREDGRSLERPQTYRAKISKDWISKTPTNPGSLADTTKPLAEFFIQVEGRQIRITVHNFPTDSIEQRVLPLSQISRWKRQFEEIDPSSILIVPEARGGFAGLAIECSGLCKGQLTTLHGWSMQLAPEHYRSLSGYPLDGSNELRQMRADYTIKAVGPKDLMLKHRQSIRNFASSFELIQEIPSDL